MKTALVWEALLDDRYEVTLSEGGVYALVDSLTDEVLVHKDIGTDGGIAEWEQLAIDTIDGQNTKRTIQERFESFHSKNPNVYATLVELARRGVNSGHKKLGIGMLWEVMRWEVYFNADDSASEYKLANDYRSRYARLIMEQEPDLEDIFEIRKLHTP